MGSKFDGNYDLERQYILSVLVIVSPCAVEEPG